LFSRGFVWTADADAEGFGCGDPGSFLLPFSWCSSSFFAVSASSSPEIGSPIRAWNAASSDAACSSSAFTPTGTA
jgi:hypothetical protein